MVKLIRMLRPKSSNIVSPYPLLPHTTIDALLPYTTIDTSVFRTSKGLDITVYSRSDSNNISASFSPEHHSTALCRVPSDEIAPQERILVEQSFTTDRPLSFSPEHHSTALGRTPGNLQFGDVTNEIMISTKPPMKPKRGSVKLSRKKSRMYKQLRRGETFLRKMCKPRSLPDQPSTTYNSEVGRSLPTLPYNVSQCI